MGEITIVLHHWEVAAIIVAVLAGVGAFYYFIRQRDRAYDELFQNYQEIIKKQMTFSNELAQDVSDVVNFTIAYSMFRKARGRKRKGFAKLEMGMRWDELPTVVQEALAKIGAEAGLKGREDE